jgi:hypothetical protein
MAIKISLFIVFIVAVEALNIAQNRLLNILYRLAKDEARRRSQIYSFLSVQLILLLDWTAFYLFILILSGFFDYMLFVVSVLSTEIALVIGYVLRALISPRQEGRAKSSAVSAGIEFDLSHPLLIKIHGYALFSLPMLYEVACGLIYFLSDRDQLPTRMFQATTIFFLLRYTSGYVKEIPIIASGSLDDRTRNGFLASLISRLLPTFLLLAIAFWAFGVGDTGNTLAVGTARITVSSSLIVTCAIIAFIVIPLPFVYGTWRSNDLLTIIAKAKVGWYQRAITAILPPTALLYEERLKGLQSSIDSEIDRLTDSNRVLQLGIDNELRDDELSLVSGRVARAQGQAQENSQVMQLYRTALNPQARSPEGISEDQRQLLMQAWEDAREVDPRFQYLSWLRQLKSDLEGTLSNLRSRHNDLERETAAGAWAISYRDRRDQLERKANEPRSSTAPVVAAFGTVATTGLGVMMDVTGKWVWQTFVSGLLK